MKKLLLAIITAMLWLSPFMAMADIVHTSWASPVGADRREKGEDLLPSDIKEYRIYIISADSNDPDVLIVDDPLAITHTFEYTKPGNYDMYLTVVDIDGRESVYGQNAPISIGSNPLPVEGFKSAVTTTTTTTDTTTTTTIIIGD